MLRIKIWLAMFVIGGLFVFMSTQSVSNAQWQNSTSGNATNSTSAGNATNATSPVSTTEGEQVGKIAGQCPVGGTTCTGACTGEC